MTYLLFDLSVMVSVIVICLSECWSPAPLKTGNMANNYKCIKTGFVFNPLDLLLLTHSIISRNRTCSHRDWTSRPPSPEFSGWTKPAHYEVKVAAFMPMRFCPILGRNYTIGIMAPLVECKVLALRSLGLCGSNTNILKCGLEQKPFLMGLT